MVQTLRGLMAPRTVLIGLGLALLAVLVYELAPSLSISGKTPFESSSLRIISAIAAPFAFAVFSIARQRGNQIINTRITSALAQVGLGGRGGELKRATAIGSEGLASGSVGALTMRTAVSTDARGAVGELEVQALAGRFKDALSVLKKRRFSSTRGGRWLYQLPWYVIIGPPGSGKTTAIMNSGLSFPLADKLGRSPLGGVGGTRNCDWWFTDDAVLIDTAGRYTTQDSDAEQDRAAWLGFLGLLKRYRRRQPLNGVFVAIGISELTSANEDVRLEHAARIRQRVGELYKELGIRLPVYMLFTKADLIAGFIEYFDDLGREGREAVWGLTFPLASSEGGANQVEQYAPEFDALIGRLDERLLERVQQEGDIQRRALVFGFPQQVASLKDLTAQFLRETFDPNSFEDPIMLRGVYFVSGTQVGTPFDRVMDAMSRTFGVAHRPQPAFAGNKRSYFLNRLLREVVFGEAGLVDSDPRIARQMKWLRISLLSSIGVLVLGLGGFWIVSYLRNEAMIGRIESASADYAQKATNLKLDRVSDSDLRAVIPLLDELRGMETGYADTRRSSGWLVFLGLDQHAKLGTETRAAYRHALSAILLPRLILRLESELAARRDDSAFIYPALEVYLMLGRQGSLSADAVRRWMALDWASEYTNSAEAPLREALARHLDALLEAPFADISLDNALIEQSRATLRSVPLAQRVIDAIATSPEAAKLFPWRLADNAGPAADSVLHLRSGQSLSVTIPGLYTREGFLTVFQPMLSAAADAIVAKGWVLGTPQAAEGGSRTTSEQLQRDATGLYLQEFALRWDHLISDVAIKPTTTVDEALRTLDVLSAPTSPIRLLIVSAAKETSLDSPTGPSAAGDRSAPGNGSAGEGRRPDDLATLFKTAPPVDSPTAIAASELAEHFKALHQLVQIPPNSGPDAKPPIDTAIADLGALYRSMSAGADSGTGPVQRSGQSAGAAARLQAGAANLPEPVKQWVQGVGQTSSNLSMDDAKGQLTNRWNGGPGRLCQDAIRERYPFAKGAAGDVPLGDFGRLFAAGGAIDGFFSRNLAPFVDTSQATWRYRTSGMAGIKLDSGALAQFQRAATIRDGMFANGGNTPAIGFSLSITELDQTSDNVVVDIDGQHLGFSHGAATSMRMRWPAPAATGNASVAFAPTGGGALETITTTGPWALFRLLEMGAVHRAGSPDRLQARFTANGHAVSVELRADSVVNPLDLSDLSQFRCPSNL